MERPANCSCQYDSTYRLRAPKMAPMINHGPRSRTCSLDMPLRNARRLAVHRPATNAVATITPYQVTVSEPKWKAIGCTEKSIWTNSSRGSIVVVGRDRARVTGQGAGTRLQRTWYRRKTQARRNR